MSCRLLPIFWRNPQFCDDTKLHCFSLSLAVTFTFFIKKSCTLEVRRSGKPLFVCHFCTFTFTRTDGPVPSSLSPSPLTTDALLSASSFLPPLESERFLCSSSFPTFISGARGEKKSSVPRPSQGLNRRRLLRQKEMSLIRFFSPWLHLQNIQERHRHFSQIISKKGQCTVSVSENALIIPAKSGKFNRLECFHSISARQQKSASKLHPGPTRRPGSSLLLLVGAPPLLLLCTDRHFPLIKSPFSLPPLEKTAASRQEALLLHTLSPVVLPGSQNKIGDCSLVVYRDMGI